MTKTEHSDYLTDIFSSPNKFRETLKWSTKKLKDYPNLDFDVIACKGVSGLSVAAPLALRLKKQLVVIRKTTENSHASHVVEGNPTTPTNYIIVDDLVGTNATVSSIFNSMKARGHICQGLLLYYSKRFLFKNDFLLTDGINNNE